MTIIGAPWGFSERLGDGNFSLKTKMKNKVVEGLKCLASWIMKSTNCHEDLKSSIKNVEECRGM